jgi:hypothetical protein
MALTILFNIFTNVRFHYVKIVSDVTMLQSIGIGMKRSIKKFDVLSIEEE